MLTTSDIFSAMESLNISPGDVIMIHGDAIIAAQINANKKEQIYLFIKEIFNYLGKTGTIVFPSFTYSSTKSEVFNVQKTESKVGLFSEKFRSYKGVVRSKNPIFSVCSYGKHKSEFEDSCVEDCFGEKLSGTPPEHSKVILKSS